jgi:predicted NBD/HSP70 family sugar kinase
VGNGPTSRRSGPRSRRTETAGRKPRARRSRKVLVIDVGGTHIKVWPPGRRRVIELDSGRKMTAKKMVKRVLRTVQGSDYNAVSIGYPGPVLHGSPIGEPTNLGRGWVGFDYQKAFGKPTRIINDAAMQALGSYRGGRMLFLGLGTGLGSALIVDGVLEPLELAHLPYRKTRTFEDYVGQRALERRGKKKWRRAVNDVVQRLREAVQADYVVLGGGNVKHLNQLSDGVRRGSNANAHRGGMMLWAASSRH